MSVVDEKVDGTVDGLKKVVEADEDSERLRQTKQRGNFVKYIEDKKAQSDKSLRIVSLISLQYHITTTQHHYQIMDMVIDGSEGRQAKTHSDSTNFSESADMFSLPRASPSGAFFGPSFSHLEQIRV